MNIHQASFESYEMKDCRFCIHYVKDRIIEEYDSVWAI